MKKAEKLRRFLPQILVALLVVLAVYGYFSRLPLIWPGQSITISVSDGESVTWKGLYTWPEQLRFYLELMKASAALEGEWSAPEDPWPVYGLTVHGSGSDFEAAICDGVWVDSGGRTRKTNLDFAKIWEEFEGKEHTRQGIGTIPCIRNLALRDDKWDPQFMTPSGMNVREDVTMELRVTPGQVAWTVTNIGTEQLSHGTTSGAGLDVLLDGVWYQVPPVTWKHYAFTAEEQFLPAGESVSGELWQEWYGGELPDGVYRVTFCGAAAEVSIVDGKYSL